MVNAKRCDACGQFYLVEEMDQRIFSVMMMDEGVSVEPDLCNDCNAKIEAVMQNKSTPQKKVSEYKHTVDTSTAKYKKERKIIIDLIRKNDGEDTRTIHSLYQRNGGLLTYTTFKKRILQYEEDGLIYSDVKSVISGGSEKRVFVAETKKDEIVKEEKPKRLNPYDHKVQDNITHLLILDNPGCSKGMLYRLFKEKLDVSMTILDQSIKRLVSKEMIYIDRSKYTNAYYVKAATEEKKTKTLKKPDLSTKAIEEKLSVEYIPPKKTNTDIHEIHTPQTDGRAKLNEDIFDAEAIAQEDKQVTRNPLVERKLMPDVQTNRRRWIQQEATKMVNKGLSRSEATRNAHYQWNELADDERDAIMRGEA